MLGSKNWAFADGCSIDKAVDTACYCGGCLFVERPKVSRGLLRFARLKLVNQPFEFGSTPVEPVPTRKHRMSTPFWTIVRPAKWWVRSHGKGLHLNFQKELCLNIQIPRLIRIQHTTTVSAKTQSTAAQNRTMRALAIQ